MIAIGGQLVSQLIIAMLGILVTGVAGMFAWLVRKVSTHDAALAVLLNEVNPPSKPSLRDMVGDITNKLAIAQAVATSRNERNFPK